MAEKTVLIVEDNPMNMELLVDWLTAKEYRVLQAMNAPDGLELARDQVPDLVFMDIALPGMDGVEATRQLKLDERTKEIPVIAITASSMRVDREKLAEAGCYAVILKPVDFALLDRTMKEVL